MTSSQIGHSSSLRYLTQENWIPTFWRLILNIFDFQQPGMMKMIRTIQLGSTLPGETCVQKLKKWKCSWLLGERHTVVKYWTKRLTYLFPVPVPLAEAPAPFFLFQAIISSLSTALKILGILKLGWTKHLAAEIMEAVKGPETPTGVTNSVMFGVILKGTGRLLSNLPLTSSTSNLK